MSSGVYALIGVLLGGGLTVGAQIGVGVFMARRAENAEWKIANRLVSEELERLMLDLRALIEHKVTPYQPIDDRYLSTELWEKYREVIARKLPDDSAGDGFWKGLTWINTTTSHGLRPAIAAMPPGTPLDAAMLDAVQDGFEAARGAYEALNDAPPHVRPPREIPL
jgi:hypothetical protein